MFFICRNILHCLSYCQSTWRIQDVKFFFKFHILSGFSFLFSLFLSLSSSCHFLSFSVNVGQSRMKCPIPPHLLHLFFFLFASNAFLIPSNLLFPMSVITSSSLSSS